MPKVTIKSISGEGRYYRLLEQTVVEIDGLVIGMGDYGGEPEDNMRCRDYRWVEPLLAKLATVLGAEVNIVNVTKDEK